MQTSANERKRRKRAQASEKLRERTHTNANERKPAQTTANDRNRAQTTANDRKRAQTSANDRKRTQIQRQMLYHPRSANPNAFETKRCSEHIRSSGRHRTNQIRESECSRIETMAYDLKVCTLSTSVKTLLCNSFSNEIVYHDMIHKNFGLGVKSRGGLCGEHLTASVLLS